MAEQNNNLSRFERVISLFTRVRAGEGRSIALFSLYALILMMSYYLFKTMRETLILTEFSAEVRSYATAAITLLLFFIVPLYSVLFRQGNKEQLIRWITLFFASNVLIFYMMGKAGMEALALTLSKEELRNNIHVNIVAPGLVETEMGRRLIQAIRGDGDLRKLDPSMPFRHVCTPREIASVVRFLVSGVAGYVTGQVLFVDGGLTVHL